MKYLLFLLLFTVHSTSHGQMVSTTAAPGSFAIANAAGATPIYVNENDFGVVKKAATLLQADVERVTSKKPALHHTLPRSANCIIIGTVHQSPIIDKLITEGKIKDKTAGKWEAYQIQIVNAPVPGIDKALVIIGADRRGTAYGVLELSVQMGVSPWHYWADVPAKKSNAIYYTGGLQTDAPAVKYRGIFINDEAPALSGWSKEKFGGFNHKFYEHVFELILRMKGNYLWPAMWGSAFNDDDTLNPVLADEYAIVMGTSHHEPLARAHDEWRRYGTGKWNYDSNATNLQAFWRKGIERMRSRENILSIGMRGDGDEPMTRGTATALLERIVKDQRKIIEEGTGKPAHETPQLWALYKEVQDYYDKGMRVPDDVTLLLCDDNWGNLRKLPKPGDKPHPGGYGIYYHYDYVGGPRNYKWINTNQIERTWEQMHLAYRHGVDKIWIVNVGDIKPMELPTQFFLDYAWNPERWTADNLPAYYTQWATKQFGEKHATAIGKIVATYTKYNSRRKPELLLPGTYSLQHYNEADGVVNEYNQLLARATALYKAMPAESKDAFYQLVLHPVQASANLNELYVTVAKNRLYAAKNSPQANILADKAKWLYQRDSLITKYYNDTLAGGKWSHMMDQTHLGYTYWQQPDKNSMPAVSYVQRGAAPTWQTKETIQTIKAAKGKTAQYPRGLKGNYFFEKDGYVSIEAMHFTKAVHSAQIAWKVIPNLGRTASAITTFPVTGAAQTPGNNSPHVQYNMYVADTGKFTIKVYLSPTLPYYSEGLKYAVSVDDEAPQIIDMHSGNFNAQWNKWVADNIIIKTSTHHIGKAGSHTIKYWMVDNGVVLQKIVVDFGGVKESYLGPPETLIR